MRLKEKKLLKKFAATLKKFSAQGAKKVEYGMFFCLSVLLCNIDQLTGLMSQLYNVSWFKHWSVFELQGQQSPVTLFTVCCP